MFATQASRVAPRAQKLLQQTRNMSNVLSGPPRVKVTPAEKLIHGLAIAVGCMIVPTWVLLNIKNYRGVEE